MSTAPGEREAMTDIALAWEILGGLPCEGLCGYIEDLVTFELNQDYLNIIEKKAENLYRTISQKTKSLPASNKAVNKISNSNRTIPLTPQESEQLSKYASDEQYVQQQKQRAAVDVVKIARLSASKGVKDYRGDSLRLHVRSLDAVDDFQEPS